MLRILKEYQPSYFIGHFSSLLAILNVKLLNLTVKLWANLNLEQMLYILFICVMLTDSLLTGSEKFYCVYGKFGIKGKSPFKKSIDLWKKSHGF